jgi:hypothetical protein
MSKYQTTDLGNIFNGLDDSIVRFIVALAMAANDLSLNVSLIRQYKEQGEGLYFFRLSFSHLKEIAKLINEAQKSQPIQCFIPKLDTETQNIYRNISASLVLFDNGSLTKDTLKPIRDECFHYPDVNSNNNPKYFKDLIKILIALDKKEVRFLENEESNLGHRYLFADAIAGFTVNSRLNKDIVDQISRIVFSIIQFVDHVLAFLKDKGPKRVT